MDIAHVQNATAMPVRGTNLPRPEIRDPKAWESARQFEAFFLSQVMDSMSAGIETDGLFGGGPGERAFRSMLNAEQAKIAVRSGGIGIADAVYREIIRMQEASQ